MNITFEATEKNTVSTRSNVSVDATTYRGSRETEKLSGNSFALDISGTVMDNSAYQGHGRTAEEVMQEAGLEDISARRNYMAVMSNSMSDEDFARLQEEGFHPGSTDIETVVTIVDHIKAALLKGGAHITGYTDALEEEQLQSITGSAAYARELEKGAFEDQLKKEFKAHDIPYTEENVQAVKEAFSLLSDSRGLSEGSVKYMIENGLSPTPQNLYYARFSASDDGSRQGRGYYAAGPVAGYYARKPETVDYEKLMPQMEQVICQAGLSVNEDTMDSAKWLVEKGVPLNADTLLKRQQMKELRLPDTLEAFLPYGVLAIADGKSPAQAELSQTESMLEKAADIYRRMTALTEESAHRAIQFLLEREQPLVLKNIFAACEAFRKDGQQPEGMNQAAAAGEAKAGAAAMLQGSDGIEKAQAFYGSGEAVRSRRLLEEVRLTMTVTANLKLLRSGFRIETAPMEELIERLKEAEADHARALMKEPDTEAARAKTSLYRETLFTLEEIRKGPVGIAARISPSDDLLQIRESAKAWTAVYQKAGESYEALMTAPRKDLGDSIRKAFANVDEILADMDREATPENRRVIRILGYNSMEMTEENFERVRKADELLSEVVETMNPGKVLSMIREGVNPIHMPLSELREYLRKEEKDPGKELESYSRFLYGLEQKKNITPEERSAYIGIFRLLHQLEKSDGAALGAVVDMGVEETLENLLSAMRSSKKGSMDYKVDDGFGGLSSKELSRGERAESISEQIEKGYRKTARQFAEAVSDIESKAAEKEFDRQLFAEARTAMKSEEAVMRQLFDYGISFTPDNLAAGKALLQGGKGLFEQLLQISGAEREGLSKAGKAGEAAKRTGKETSDSGKGGHLFWEGETGFPEALTGQKEAYEAYRSFAENRQAFVEREAFSGTKSAREVKALHGIYKQLGFLKSMAEEESYEMPVDIDGTLTAVNLKMIHRNGEESRVFISLETEGLGRAAGEFTYGETGLTGYGICSRPEGSRLLEAGRPLLEAALWEEGLLTGDIRFLTGEEKELSALALKAGRNRQKGNTPKILYRAAKAYIGYIQKVSRQKGNREYENQL